MSVYIKGFNLIKKKFRNSIAVLVFLTIFGAILEGVSIALILPMIELLTNPGEIFENKFLNLSFLFKKEFSYNQLIYFYLILFFLIYVMKNIFIIMVNYSQSKILLNINFYLSNRIFKKLLNENFLSVIEKKSSSVIRTMISQTNIFALNFINSASILIAEFLTFLFILSFVLLITAKEFYAVILILIIILIFYYLFFKKKIYELSKNTEKEEIKRLNNLTNGFNSINEINIFDIKDYFISSDFKINNQIIKLALTTSLIRVFPRSIIEIVLIFLFVIFAFYLIDNNFNFVDFLPSLAVLGAALFKFIPTLNKCMIAFQRIGGSKPIIENICKNLDTSNQKLFDNKNFNHTFNKNLSLKNLSFSYPNSKEKIFDNLNLLISQNEKIGIYGDTGSGKSTLIKILMGIIPPSSGNIEIDNSDIHKNVEGWQKLISYIPQKIFLFDSSIIDNIRLYDTENKDRLDKIILKVFQNQKYFENLSDRVKSNPAKLSGGETKKVGVARALYKKHKILLIDEGTAGLDDEYSKYLISELLKLNKTIIFISHDYHQLDNFDHIYKIKNYNIIKKK